MTNVADEGIVYHRNKSKNTFDYLNCTKKRTFTLAIELYLG